MPNIIQLKLLDNKQIKVEKSGIPLANENSYRIVAGEENVTQFTIASKPAQYANADYYVIFINSQNKRAFLDDIIPEPIPDDGQLLTSDTFTLPIGMAVEGYGRIGIYAIYNNPETGKTEKVPFLPIKVKIWETIGTWKNVVSDLNTPATEEWVEQYVDNALSEIDLSGYYTKIETDGLLDETTNELKQAIEKGDIVAAKSLVAKQLENVSDESGTYQDKPFLLQSTGTNSNTTKTPTAPVTKQLELRGNTIPFLQLLSSERTPSVVEVGGLTATYYSDGRVVVNGTYTGNANNVSFEITQITPKPVITGHKVLLRGCAEGGQWWMEGGAVKWNYMLGDIAYGGLRTGESGIIGTFSQNNYTIAIRVWKDVVCDNLVFYPQLFDLTEMFGAGNEPTTMEEFNRLFPEPYYPQTQDLISCKSRKLITTGYNQFTGLDEYIKVIAGQTYRVARLSGTTLLPLNDGTVNEYDYSKTLIKSSAVGTLSSLHSIVSGYPDNYDEGLILTSDTHYVKIVGSTDTNIILNLAWDGSRSDYEAFVKYEYNLPNVELHSVGSVYDSQYPNGTKIQRVGILSHQTGAIGDTITVSGMKSDTTNIVCKLGLVSEWGTVSGNVITLTKALSNVDIYYELATPITTTGGQTFAENVEVDDFGTMEFVYGGNAIAIPQGNRFFYPADYVLLIDDLNNYTNGDVSNLALKIDLINKQDKLTQSTDLTPTTQTLTLTANTRYALGTLTALNITFPASANDGDTIIIEFVSGATATTLTRDTTNAIYGFEDIEADKFIKLTAEYSISLSKWVVKGENNGCPILPLYNGGVQ